MSLNIKNEETHALVRELASRTGMSQAEAVRAAVSESLRRLDTEPDAKRRYAAITATAAEIATHLNPDATHSSDDDLYDEHGLFA